MKTEHKKRRTSHAPNVKGSPQEHNKLLATFIVARSPGVGKKTRKGELKMNYDSWKLRSPEEDYQARLGLEHICDCENCCESLFAGEQVVKDTEDDIYFCSETCFEEYHKETRMLHTELESKRGRLI